MRTLAPLLAAAVALGAPADAAEFEDPDTGYAVRVPAEYKHKYNAPKKILWVAGAGGLRVRFETRTSDTPIAPDDAKRWYSSDGRSLVRNARKVKALRKPTEDPSFGDQRKAWFYAFGYEPGPGRAFGYVTDGTSKTPGKRLQLRAYAYGPAKVVTGERKRIEAMLATVTWPQPAEAAPPPPPADRPGEDRIATAALTPPPAEPAPRDPPPQKGDGSGYVPDGSFNRGSLTGSIGALENGGVVYNPKRTRRFLKAFTSGISGGRSEKERDRSAAYLGFKKQKKD